ncbi:MAG: alpha/beta hydrolase [Pseudomonadota bacterium]|nr:alpha/beta hydrolase [Pseudomonadota bacterium]
MHRETVEANGLNFSCLTAGPAEAPLLLMLHGFPEFSGGWEEMIDRLSDRFFCVAPDQRGYNLSDKPEGVAAYSTGKLVSDALGVLDHYRPGGRAHALIGHDWGAGVAYAAAMRAPERFERLIIANGVHPLPFQRALASDPGQGAASQYIHFLRQPDSHEKLATDDFSGVMRLLWAKMDTAWMTPEATAKYKAAWGRPGAMNGMVNWYRAARIAVPPPGGTLRPEELPDLPAEAMRIVMPHLLIWGMDDSALLPVSRAGLEDLCDDLTVRELEGCDHWLMHQKPDEVAALMRDFLDRPLPG